MDEETAIIDSNARNERIKNFLIRNKNRILIFLGLIVFLLLLFFGYGEFKENNKIKISDRYNSLTIQYDEQNQQTTLDGLEELVLEKDSTYSPLALYFIIDRKLTLDKEKINTYFDVLINDTSLDKEILNLIIYKKALYNADTISEIDLLNILKPITNSESVWKSHALYLIAEYFFSKDQKEKSKEFFQQITELENSNPDIKNQALKRINRDLSD
ncbi:hypothetical protein [Candidatus Pelagibacter sp.]|uniref:hypothetical protein n=1 Tax=Candidatus Pelagibacter sp. TaxID=2024849 RepID=UPI003F86126E